MMYGVFYYYLLKRRSQHRSRVRYGTLYVKSKKPTVTSGRVVLLLYVALFKALDSPIFILLSTALVAQLVPSRAPKTHHQGPRWRGGWCAGAARHAGGTRVRFRPNRERNHT